MSHKKFDFFILLFLNILSIGYVLLTHKLFIGKALIAFIIFLIPFTIYLSKREKKQWYKIFASVLVFGGLFGFFFEFIQEFNKAYTVKSSLFPFKIFGILPLDNVLAHMLMTFFTMVFFEHFIGFKKSTISSRFKFIVLAALSINIIMIFLFLLQPNVLKIPYSYLFLGVIAIIPPIYLSLQEPTFIMRIAPASYYFFFLYFILELLAVKFSWWVYPNSAYIGWVEVGRLRFPFEELFFWMIFYAPALISYRILFLEKR